MNPALAPASTRLEASTQQMLDALPGAVVMIDRKAALHYANPQACEILGLKSVPQGEHALAELLRPLIQPTENPEVAIRRLFSDTTECLLRMQTDIGQAALKLTAGYLRGSDASLTGLVILLSQDKLESRKSLPTARSDRDALTGLMNRNGMLKRMDNLINDAAGSSRTHAFLLLDLDQFKLINDLSGHVAGDALLHQVGELLAASVHHGDLVARMGGDEFGILLSNVETNEAASVAGRLLATVEGMPFGWDGRGYPVSASIGVVPIGEHTQTAKRVLGQADSALFAAKDRGRNRFHIYSPADDEIARRNSEMEWVAHINDALAGEGLCLALQPIVPARKTDEGGHFELLIRMHHDDRLVSPGEFLPAAERFGLMGKIDRWVVNRFLDHSQDNPALTRRLRMCAINLSGASLGDIEFLNFLKSQLDRPHVRPETLCFEVTETVAINNIAMARRFISEIKERGCKFSLDDFGSGMSSFGYLRQLPVDYVKIDGVFVRDMDTDPVHRSLVQAINDIAHSMGKQTIAEFVVNETVQSMLQEMDVDYLQGYFIGEPAMLEAE